MEKIRCAAVVGPTASGKTALAVELAKSLQGEVISADSMQIYRDMQIATAKPTAEEMQGIPHHLMDFLSPEESFSVSDYVQLARQVIDDVTARGKLPIVCGGTGLYVSSLLEYVQFEPTQTDPKRRQELYEEAQKDGGQALYEKLQKADPKRASEIHPNNLVRVVRAWELYESTGKTMDQLRAESHAEPSPYDACIIGLNFRDRAKLYARIDRRVDLMMEQGLLEEARRVLQNPQLKTAYNAIGYKELRPYFEHQASLESCLERMKMESRRYAKRQLTWFRRNPQIHWLYVDEMKSFEQLLKLSQNLLVNHYNL